MNVRIDVAIRLADKEKHKDWYDVSHSKPKMVRISSAGKTSKSIENFNRRYAALIDYFSHYKENHFSGTISVTAHIGKQKIILNRFVWERQGKTNILKGFKSKYGFFATDYHSFIRFTEFEGGMQE